MKKLLVVGVGMVVVLGAVLWLRDRGVVSELVYRVGQEMASECEETPVFGVLPAELSKIELISPPIMKVNSGVKSHSYIETSEPVPVYAPVDGRLVRGAKYTEDYVDSSKIQYTLYFEVGCGVSYYYDHLIDVPEKIADEFAGEPRRDTRSRRRISVEVKAGEVVGYSWSRQFDFGVIDKSTEPALAGFEEYRYSDKAYAVCPLKFFDESLKEELKEKVGYFEANDLVVLDNLCEKD